MYRLLKCTKDGYITNRIINNSYRATGANTGYAATLDLFQLWDESSISGSEQPFERSRLLMHFDLNQLRALTGSTLDISLSGDTVHLSWSSVHNTKFYRVYYAPYSDISNVSYFDLNNWIDGHFVEQHVSFDADLPAGSAYYVAVESHNWDSRSSQGLTNIKYFIVK